MFCKIRKAGLCKITKTTLGQITIEASIIVPLVMIVIVSLIYMAFYAHDIISIRSGVYSMALEDENNKGVMPSLFVMKPGIIKTGTINETKIRINMAGKGNVTYIRKIIEHKEDELLTVQKMMDKEILYKGRALLDMKNKGGD